MQKRFGPSCMRTEQRPCFDRELWLHILIRQSTIGLSKYGKTWSNFMIGRTAIEALTGE